MLNRQRSSRHSREGGNPSPALSTAKRWKRIMPKTGNTPSLRAKQSHPVPTVGLDGFASRAVTAQIKPILF